MPPLRGRGDAQLRDLQPAGRARRHVPARPAPDHQGQYHRAGPLDLGADPVLDQHQPRADLRPAAADLAVGLLEPGLRAALPAHRAHDRDQDLHRLPPVSQSDDNNAIMAQLLLLGTNFVNFVGLHAWIGLDGGFEAMRVTEWDEPQAVIGSYLQRYRLSRLSTGCTSTGTSASWSTGRAAQTFDRNLSGETRALEQFANVVQGTRGRGRLPAACAANICSSPKGSGGFRVYDIASIANKGVSERIITAPVLAARPGHARRQRATRPAWRCRPTSRSRRPQRGDGEHAAPQPDGSTITCSRRIRSSASTRSTTMPWSPTPRRA